MSGLGPDVLSLGSGLQIWQSRVRLDKLTAPWRNVLAKDTTCPLFWLNFPSDKPMPKVTFVKEKITVEAAEGEDIRTIARKNGIQLYSGPHKYVNCMGNGLCCSCDVIVKKGSDNCSAKGPLELANKWVNPLLGLKHLSNPEEDVRLSCRTKVHGDVEVVTNPPINWHGDKFWN